MEEQPKGFLRLSRRGLLKGLGAGAAGTAVAAPAARQALAAAEGDAGPVKIAKGRVPITLKVNGASQRATVEPRQTLLEVLRDQLDLTGAKPVCNHASCGACTVRIDGNTRYSCQTLAIDADGHDIVTVEGIAPKEGLHPVQAAFVEKDALMCGFCTPGFVVSVSTLLEKNPRPTLEEVKRACAGNTCRCGTYPRIFEAAMAAAQRMRKEA